MSAALSAFTQQSTPITTINAEPDDLEGGDQLEKCCRWFEDAELALLQSREMAEKCRDFYDGRQISAEEEAVLKRRRQPVIVNNKIRPKIQLLLGLERKGRSDPKAFPRTPTQDDRADVATQVLRYIADDQRYDVVRSSVFENMLIEGVGGCEVLAEPADDGKSSQRDSQGGYDVVINHIPYERLFWDPHSRHAGFSDARYLGQVIWMDREEALGLYPGCEDILETTFGSEVATYEDRPNLWCDTRRRRVRVVQMHWKRGQAWFTGTFCRGGWVDGPMRSPYLDRHDRPTCPLILRSAFCDRDNNRYGAVRDMIPLQDAINKRESKLLHSLNVNRIRMEEGAVADVAKAQNEAAKPDGVIVVRPNLKFDIDKDTNAIEGQFKLLEYSIAQMQAAGPNASMSGKDPRELSGRAIIAQQSGGVTEHEPLADELRQHTHKTFEASWCRAKQFWGDAKTIRITDDARAVKFVTLNQPVTLLDELKAMPPAQAQQAMQGMRIVSLADPRLQMVIRTDHSLDDMDVDITVEEGPDVPTQQAEQWQAFTQLPETVLSQFPPEFFIEANPAIRDKSKLIAILEQHQKAQAAQQQAQQQFQREMQQAQLGKVQADTADKQAQAQDRGAQTVTRLHGMAMDHAAAQDVPVVPGVGPVQPADNPLLQPQPTVQPPPAPQPQGPIT